MSIFLWTSAVLAEIVCTPNSDGKSEIDRMLGFEKGLQQTQCDYNGKTECRYSQESCERSIGCANIIMEGALKDSPNIFEWIQNSEIRDYGSAAVDVQRDNMKEVASLIDYAKSLKMTSIPSTCKQDYFSVHNSSSCDAALLDKIELEPQPIGSTDAAQFITVQVGSIIGPEYNDFTNDDKNILKKKNAISKDNGCNTDGLSSISALPNEKIAQTKARMTDILDNDPCFRRYIFSVGTREKPLTAAGLVNGFLSAKGNNKNFGDYLKKTTENSAINRLATLCKSVPTMNDICENVTNMKEGNFDKVKNKFLDPQVDSISSLADLDSTETLQFFMQMFKKNYPGKPIPDSTVFYRLFEAARCKVGKDLYKEEKISCLEVNNILKVSQDIKYDKQEDPVKKSAEDANKVLLALNELEKLKKTACLQNTQGSYNNESCRNVNESIAKLQKTQIELLNGSVKSQELESERLLLAFGARTSTKKSVNTQNITTSATIPASQNSVVEKNNDTPAATQGPAAPLSATGTAGTTTSPTSRTAEVSATASSIPQPFQAAISTGSATSPTRAIASTPANIQEIQTKIQDAQTKLDQLKADAENTKKEDEVSALKKEIEKSKATIAQLQEAKATAQATASTSSAAIQTSTTAGPTQPIPEGQASQQQAAIADNSTGGSAGSPATTTAAKSSSVGPVGNKNGGATAKGEAAGIQLTAAAEAQTYDLGAPPQAGTSVDPAYLAYVSKLVAKFPTLQTFPIDPPWEVIPTILNGKVVSVVTRKRLPTKIATKIATKRAVTTDNITERKPASIATPATKAPTERDTTYDKLKALLNN
jgi:hypothetical protein